MKKLLPFLVLAWLGIATGIGYFVYQNWGRSDEPGSVKEAIALFRQRVDTGAYDAIYQNSTSAFKYQTNQNQLEDFFEEHKNQAGRYIECEELSRYFNIVGIKTGAYLTRVHRTTYENYITTERFVFQTYGGAMHLQEYFVNYEEERIQQSAQNSLNLEDHNNINISLDSKIADNLTIGFQGDENTPQVINFQELELPEKQTPVHPEKFKQIFGNNRFKMEEAEGEIEIK